jgi:citrate lyase subunit beta / citryl-CoA lyase
VTSRELIRSLLFVPGNRAEWMAKAPQYGSDALILDLEDAVPFEAKQAARHAVSEALDLLKDEPCAIFVRINAWGSGDLLSDLQAVVRPGLDGVLLAMTASPDEISALDRVLTELEADRGLLSGGIEIVPIPETAAGMRVVFELCTASTRVRRTAGVTGATIGADRYRALGTRWTAEGWETLYTTSKTVVDARAAGVRQILSGPVAEIGDLDFARRIWARARDLGATAAMSIHPSHIPVIHEIFSPTAFEIDEAAGIMHAIAQGVARGVSAVRYEGRMIDYAHARTAAELLETAKSLGMSVPDYPLVDLK